MFLFGGLLVSFLLLSVFLKCSVPFVSAEVPRLESSNLRLQRALRACSSCFLESAHDGASLVWQVPRARTQMWSPDIRELLQFYDEQSYRVLEHSFLDLGQEITSFLDFEFDETVSRRLASEILNVTNSERPEYEQCFRCIVLQSTVEQVLIREDLLEQGL